MAYTADAIARLKAEIDIVDLIQASGVELKRAGSNFKGLCPFHTEKTPSFMVSPGRQTFTCYGCGAHGDAIGFEQQYFHLSFVEAVEKLASSYGLTLETTKRAGEDLSDFYRINQEAARYYYKAFTTTANPGYSYMKGRQIPPGILKRFGIGYADASYDGLFKYLTAKGFSARKIEALGLFRSFQRGGGADKFRDRVMFPIINLSGKVIGFGGRAIRAEESPKYLNSPESRIFKKKNNLYGLSLARQAVLKEDLLLLVEGYMDVIGLVRGGIGNVAASLGTALTTEQAKLIKRFTENVVLCYDADKAGRAAALRGIDILQEQGLSVRVMHVNNGKDPDEFINKEGADAFRELVKKALPAAEYQLQTAVQGYDLADPDQKRRAAHSVLKVLQGFSPVDRDIYRARAAQELGVSEIALRAEGEREKEPVTIQKARAMRRAEGIRPTELEVLRLLTVSPEMVDTVYAQMESLFTSAKARRLFDAFSADKEEYGDIDASRVQALIGEEDQSALEGVYRLPPPPDPAALLHECLRRGELERLRREEASLLQTLSSGAGTEEEQKETLENLMRVQNRIKKIKGANADEQ